MNRQTNLEDKTFFRICKVIFIILIIGTLAITFFIWFTTQEWKLDASESYFTCNGLGNIRQELTADEKQVLEESVTPYFGFNKGPENTRISKECYRIYSGGEDPDQASAFDRQLFSEMQKGVNDKVYLIEGTKPQKEWHFGYLILALLIETIVFYLIRIAGLYIFGGRRAVSG